MLCYPCCLTNLINFKWKYHKIHNSLHNLYLFPFLNNTKTNMSSSEKYNYYFQSFSLGNIFLLKNSTKIYISKSKLYTFIFHTSICRLYTGNKKYTHIFLRWWWEWIWSYFSIMSQSLTWGDTLDWNICTIFYSLLLWWLYIFMGFSQRTRTRTVPVYVFIFEKKLVYPFMYLHSFLYWNRKRSGGANQNTG